MKSLHERLLDAAKELENENYHNQATLLREAAGALPEPKPSVTPISPERNCHPCPHCCGTGWTGPGRAGSDSCTVCRGTGHLDPLAKHQPDPVDTRVRRQFDPVLVGALAQVIYESGMHAQTREDTIGVLMYYGAYNGEPVETARNGFVADLATAIDAWKATRLSMANRSYSVEKPKFGDLKVGEHFICPPQPGDNHGHGGYLGQQRLFVKTATNAPHMHLSGFADSGSGAESTFPHSMPVIRVTLA